MPSIYSRALLLASVLHATATSAIKLSDFTPKAQNLSASCQTVYDSTIDGCDASDFGKGAQCSDSCIAGLASVQMGVVTACQNDKNGDNQIIGWMLTPKGISVLCPAASTSSSAGSGLPTSDAAPISTEVNATPTSGSSPTPTDTQMSAKADTSSLLVAPTPASLSPTGETPRPTATPSSTLISLIVGPTTATTSASPAEVSAQLAAASLCAKGDSSEHGGSLMDTSCSSASSLLGLRDWTGILAFFTVTMAVLWA